MIIKDEELTCFTSFTCAYRKNTESVFLRLCDYVINTISNFFARKRRCRSVGGRAAKYTKITLKMVSHVSLYRYSTMYEEVPGVMRFKILENEFLV